METLIQLIPTVGFPIVAALASGLFVYKIWLRDQETSERREEKVLEQLASFGETLKNFNETLIRIDARLEVLEKKVIN